MAVLLTMGFWADSVEAASSKEVDVWSTVSAKSDEGLLLDVTKAGSRLVMVGERGHILFSDVQVLPWSSEKRI